MSALEAEPGPVTMRRVTEGRPRAYRFGGGGSVDPGDVSIDVGAAAADAQPSLLDALRELTEESIGAPRPGGVRMHTDPTPGAISPAAPLPEPGRWAATLGLAIGQSLVGSRPLGQLAPWLDPTVLAELRYAVHERHRADALSTGRARPAAATGGAVPKPRISVVSVRVQCPTPTAVEATIHLRVGSVSSGLGLRLDAYGERWICTALARPVPGRELSGPQSARDTA